MARLEMWAAEGLPPVRRGDDLLALALAGWTQQGTAPRDGDVLVLAQKVVSKAEGRLVDLAGVQPSARALEVAARVHKDPRLVELILAESRRVVRMMPGVLIVEHRLGFVMANAGVDQSNVGGSSAGDGTGAERALLLPEDPDASAERLRLALARQCGAEVAVLVNDSFGRPWRRGSVGVALGCAGLAAWLDLRGRTDLDGRTLRVSEVALADELAAAASLLMGQADEGRPLVVLRGAVPRGPWAPARALVRPAAEDLFR